MKANVVFFTKGYPTETVWIYDARTNVAREEGQALVEYALILAMIAVVTIAVLQALGVDVSKILDKVSTSLSSLAG